MSVAKRLLAGLGIAGIVSLSGTGVVQAVPPLETNGAVTDASSDTEVANYAYRDLTMNRKAHEQAIEFASGSKSAVQATRTLNQHLGRYCASAGLIMRALADQGYNSATIQNFHHQAGCLTAPAVTHQDPAS